MPWLCYIIWLCDGYKHIHLVDGLEHFFFPFSWECHHPNWRTLHDFSGRWTTKVIYTTHNPYICHMITEAAKGQNISVLGPMGTVDGRWDGFLVPKARHKKGMGIMRSLIYPLVMTNRWWLYRLYPLENGDLPIKMVISPFIAIEHEWTWP